MIKQGSFCLGRFFFVKYTHASLLFSISASLQPSEVEAQGPKKESLFTFPKTPFAFDVPGLDSQAISSRLDGSASLSSILSTDIIPKRESLPNFQSFSFPSRSDEKKEPQTAISDRNLRPPSQTAPQQVLTDSLSAPKSQASAKADLLPEPMYSTSPKVTSTQIDIPTSTASQSSVVNVESAVSAPLSLSKPSGFPSSSLVIPTPTISAAVSDSKLATSFESMGFLESKEPSMLTKSPEIILDMDKRSTALSDSTTIEGTAAPGTAVVSRTLSSTVSPTESQTPPAPVVMLPTPNESAFGKAPLLATSSSVSITPAPISFAVSTPDVAPSAPTPFGVGHFAPTVQQSDAMMTNDTIEVSSWQPQPMSSTPSTLAGTMSQPAAFGSAFGSFSAGRTVANPVPVFGSTTFAPPSNMMPTVPTFGSPSFGTTGFSASAFGTPAQPVPAFGTSSFGSLQKSHTFGSIAPSSSSKPSFGQVAQDTPSFGSVDQAAAVSQPTFGSLSQTR